MKPHATDGTKVEVATLEMFELVFGLEQRENWKRFPFFVLKEFLFLLISPFNILEQFPVSPFLCSLKMEETGDNCLCIQAPGFVRYVHAGAINVRMLIL
jgi:hypothetical protein